MKPIQLSAVLTSALILLSFSPAQSQDDPFGDGGGAARSQRAKAQPNEPPRFDIEFIDTPVSDACEFIAMRMEEAGAEPLNIVVSKEAADIALPSMSLRQITFEQFVSFINRIGGAPAYTEGDDPFSSDGGSYMPQRHGPRFGLSDSDGIWYFWADKAAPATGGGMESEMMAGAAAEPIDTRVYPLDGEVEPTLGLIEEALAETRRHMQRPEPSLKFHEPSSTLIVTGSVADLSMIEEVISVMHSRQTQNQQRQQSSLVSSLHSELEKLKQTLDHQMRLAEEDKQRHSIQYDKVIAQLETQLAEMNTKYTEIHPKMIQLQAELEKALEAQKDAK